MDKAVYFFFRVPKLTGSCPVSGEVSGEKGRSSIEGHAYVPAPLPSLAFFSRSLHLY